MFFLKTILLLDILFVHTSYTVAHLLSVRDGPSPALPFDNNTSEYCSWWVDITWDYPCLMVLEDNFISLDDFRRWNPTITATCGNLVEGRSYCVEAVNEPPPPISSSAQISSVVRSTTTKLIASSTTPAVITSASTLRTISSSTPPSSTTKPGNGITTPSPLQPTIAPNCDKFSFVNVNENCDTIAKANGITPSQFISWNPSAGATCSGLWADAYACVSIIGHEPSPPPTTTTTTKPGNGIATPTPVQAGIVGNCDSFYKIRTGDTCDKIARPGGVTSGQIISWNPAAGSKCTGLWPDYYICVSVIGDTVFPTCKYCDGRYYCFPDVGPCGL